MCVRNEYVYVSENSATSSDHVFDNNIGPNAEIREEGTRRWQGGINRNEYI